MHIELTDEQTEALIRELSQLIDGHRYPLSPRIRVLKEILRQLRPEPERELLPPTASLRATEQGAVCTATRLASDRISRVNDRRLNSFALEHFEINPPTFTQRFTVGPRMSLNETFAQGGKQHQLKSR
jgi:hypothetical protein